MPTGSSEAKMLRLELLPGGSGDCIWFEYGKPGDAHIVLIDGGVMNTYEYLDTRIREKLHDCGATGVHFELLVVTHIDNDHIEGILRLLNETRHKISFGDIWFNGNQQLKNLPQPTTERKDRLGNDYPPRPDLLGLKEGDELSVLLPSRNLPWNKKFKGKAVMLSPEGRLPARKLKGGLKLTLLGPPLERLQRLAADWKSVMKDYDYIPTGSASERKDILGLKDTWPPAWQPTTSTDGSVTNGSSLSILAEFEGHSLLLSGDAFADDLADNLTKLQQERGLGNGQLPITALKLPHHGSARNVTEKLLSRIQCGYYLISTNGSGRQRHPDHQALLSILKYSTMEPCLAFNYGVETTRKWGERVYDVRDRGFPNYKTLYPANPNKGLVLVWEKDNPIPKSV
jgi:beta-lactamase superfamily II metal-dependent hydrolase